jgi:hypothetical protein
MTAIRQTLRDGRREVDLVLLAGAGAATYAEATRATYPPPVWSWPMSLSWPIPRLLAAGEPAA